ncbi:MAG TPA: hypothetical protein ENJ95_16570 [Bacteroidetes bacterium]|nr:hypothetical protein [Bacteroidota bacterium]
MKNTYLPIFIFLFFISSRSFAQTIKNDPKLEFKNGRMSVLLDDGNIKFTPGGRFTMDAAYLKEDITPLGSGSRVKEARINMALKVKKFSYFFEIDFERSEIRMKDLTARYNFTDHNFIKVGHYTEPFSPNYLTTTKKVSFIGRPNMASAFAPSRALGISFRHYQKRFWFEGGIFGENVNQKYNGDDGYALTGRLVGIPVEMPGSHLHFGFSASYRLANNRGLDDDGSSYYNRKINYTAGLQNYIDQQIFLASYVGPSGSDSYGQNDLEDLRNGGAKNQLKFDFEIMDIYKNFNWQVEFITTRVNRVMNKAKILEFERDGGLYPETWEDIKWKYGEPRSLNFYGYNIKASWLIFGGQYKYSKYSSTLSQITNRALEFSLRYSYTNLNDTEGDFINGKFYTKEGKNLSMTGGETGAFSAALNYIINANLRIVGDYTFQMIDNYSAPDEDIHIIQARVQAMF